MFYLFVGAVRSGKTISAICELKKFYDMGYTIYSNTHLEFNYKPLSRKMILLWEKVEFDLPPKTAMFIDEIGAWFDSRNSAYSNNKVFSYFINQLGKFTDDKSKGLTLIGTIQYFSGLDIRGRRATYNIIECKKVYEVKDEYIHVLRTWKLNRDLILKTFKREKVKFDIKDFKLYNTQQKIVSEIN